MQNSDIQGIDIHKGKIFQGEDINKLIKNGCEALYPFDMELINSLDEDSPEYQIEDQKLQDCANRVYELEDGPIEDIIFFLHGDDEVDMLREDYVS